MDWINVNWTNYTNGGTGDLRYRNDPGLVLDLNITAVPDKWDILLEEWARPHVTSWSWSLRRPLISSPFDAKTAHS